MDWFVFGVTLLIGVALVATMVALDSQIDENSTRASRLAAVIVLVGLFLPMSCAVAQADSIPAEEIEVPPPEWSVFFEPPAPPLAPPVAEDPIGPFMAPSTTPQAPPKAGPQGPSIVAIPVPFNLCWFKRCGNGDTHYSPAPPPPSTTQPIPEPTAALLFGLGLLILGRRCLAK